MSDSQRPPAESGGESLEEETDKNLLIQQALNAILRIGLEPISLDEQMHRVLDLILKLPFFLLEPQGCIFLVENGSGELVMKTHIGMAAGVLSTCSRVGFGSCLCGRAIAENEIVFAGCGDECHTTSYPGMYPHGHYCVPIGCGGRRIGVLNLYVREGHKRSPVEERFLWAVADVLAGVIERQQTLERYQEQLLLAQIGKDVGLAICQGDSLPDMLQQCVEAIVRHLNGAFARIWTVNEAKNVLELQASAGLYKHIDGAHSRVSVGQYKIGLIAQERKPYLTNAVLGDPQVHDQGWARREGMVAFAGYPLLVEDRLVGVMAMFARHLLSEATVDTLASVANGIALGIERKRIRDHLLEELSERKTTERRLAAEHAVSSILAVSHDLNDAALKVIQAICASLDCDGGTLWLVDRNAQVLRCVETWHKPGDQLSPFAEVTRQITFSPEIGMPGRVWAREKLCWVPDVTVDTNFPRRQVAAQCGVHAAVGFPIRDERQVQGVLEFYSREIRQPDENLIEMMTSIGSQISQFIERRRTESELQKEQQERQIARKIQQGLLPKAMPRLPGFKISGRSLTTSTVSGDCFDFIPFMVQGQECWGILVAEASGHGLDSALLMAQTHAYLRALAMTYTGLHTLLTLTNRHFADDFMTDHYVSLILAQLNPSNRTLLYVNAGHCLGCVIDRQGKIRADLSTSRGPLGIDPANKYQESSISLEKGDLVLLATDGIIRATSQDKRLFGLKRMFGILRAHIQQTPNEILDALLGAVSDFTGHQLQDDITAVILKADDD